MASYLSKLYIYIFFCLVIAVYTNPPGSAVPQNPLPGQKQQFNNNEQPRSYQNRFGQHNQHFSRILPSNSGSAGIFLNSYQSSIAKNIQYIPNYVNGDLLVCDTKVCIISEKFFLAENYTANCYEDYLPVDVFTKTGSIESISMGFLAPKTFRVYTSSTYSAICKKFKTLVNINLIYNIIYMNIHFKLFFIKISRKSI